MRLLVCHTLVAAVLSLSVNAQDRTDQAGRQQPPSRPADVASPASSSTLPTIDLPEFVITGSASINPPDVQKGLYEEGGATKRNPLDNTPGSRDRETIDLGARFKQSQLTNPEGLYGIAGADLGTFFTSNIFGAFGRSSETYDILGEADYARTRGFIRFTDASSGNLKLRGSLVLGSPSALLNGARVSGAASYGLSKYKFYGSVSPAIQRNWSAFDFLVAGVTSLDSPAMLTAGLEYKSFAVRDSTAETTENRVTIGASAKLPVLDFPINVSGGLTLATITSGSSNNVSLTTLSLGIPPLSWPDMVVQISATGFLVKGMAGQEGSYFYPHVLLRFSGIQAQTLFLEFTPTVTYASLEGHIQAHPYLSSNAALRHEIHRWQVSGGIESEWTGWLNTRMELRAHSIDNYPLYADSSKAGFWTLRYGGRTSIVSLKLDAVANITTNDYFAVALRARSAKNSVFGNRIPYLAEFEASAVYRHRFPFELSVSPSLSFLGARKAGVAEGESVGSCFWSGIRTEYDGIPRLSVFLDVQNALNRRYDVWKGYRAEPFRMSLGLSYRW